MNNFVDYETARKIKELGFKEWCYGFFATHEGKQYVLDSIKTRNEGHAVSAPMWQQIKNWLWENHKIWINIWRPYAGENQINDKYVYSAIDCNNLNVGGDTIACGILDEIDFSSPIEAEINGIKKSVELLYNKKNGS